MREKIWYMLIDTKTNEYFTEYIVRKYQKIDLAVNIFLGIFTSGSVMAWAIWEKIPVIWAILVGLTQLIFVTSPLIGLPKSIKVYLKINSLLRFLAIEFEKLWYKYENGKLSDETVADEFFSLM